MAQILVGPKTEANTVKPRSRVQSAESRVQSPVQILYYAKKKKEIKEDISIVKLHMSNLHKAFIPRTNSTETIIKTVLCITRLMPK